MLTVIIDRFLKPFSRTLLLNFPIAYLKTSFLCFRKKFPFKGQLERIFVLKALIDGKLNECRLAKMIAPRFTLKVEPAIRNFTHRTVFAQEFADFLRIHR